MFAVYLEGSQVAGERPSVTETYTQSSFKAASILDYFMTMLFSFPFLFFHLNNQFPHYLKPRGTNLTSSQQARLVCHVTRPLAGVL